MYKVTNEKVQSSVPSHLHAALCSTSGLSNMDLMFGCMISVSNWGNVYSNLDKLKMLHVHTIIFNFLQKRFLSILKWLKTLVFCTVHALKNEVIRPASFLSAVHLLSSSLKHCGKMSKKINKFFKWTDNELKLLLWVAQKYKDAKWAQI